LALAALARRRSSASASARFAAGDSGLRSGVDTAASGGEESSVIATIQAVESSYSISRSYSNLEKTMTILTFGIFAWHMRSFLTMA
jgi:hypothetical protein